MPLVRVDFTHGRPAEFRKTISDTLCDLVVSEFKAPEDDRFQIITEHPPGHVIADPNFGGVNRTADVIFIQVTMNFGRSIAQKKSFYKRVVDQLHERLGVRREDVFINLVEVEKENRSFGNGLAQYADQEMKYAS